MKRKSLFYVLMIVFAFVLPSFSSPDKGEKGSSTEKTMATTSDSLSLTVKFQNPKLIVEQENLVQKLQDQSLVSGELVEVMKNLGITFNKYVTLEQNKSDPLMTQWCRQTGYSIGQINTFIKQRNTLKIVISFTGIILTLVLLIIFNTSYRRLMEYAWYMFWLYLSAFVVVAISLTLLWPTLCGKDYTIFYSLLKLPFI